MSWMIFVKEVLHIGQLADTSDHCRMHWKQKESAALQSRRTGQH